MLNDVKKIRAEISKSVNEFFPFWSSELLQTLSETKRARVKKVLGFYKSARELRYLDYTFAAYWLYSEGISDTPEIRPFSDINKAVMLEVSLSMSATTFDDVFENSARRWGKPNLLNTLTKTAAKRAAVVFLLAVLKKSEKELGIDLEEIVYKALVRLWAGEFLQNVSNGTIKPTKGAFMSELPNVPLLLKFGEKAFSKLNITKHVGFTLQTAEKICRLKNGTFFGFKMELGACLAGGLDNDAQKLLYEIGDYLGILDQIRNDLKNLVDLSKGRPSSDLKHCLYTLPLIILSSDPGVKTRLDKLMGLETSGSKELRDILGYVKHSRNAKKLLFKKVLAYSNKVEDNIQKLPNSPPIARKILFDCLDELVQKINDFF